MSAATLAEAIRKNKQIEVKVRHMTFICKRPTMEYLAIVYKEQHTDAQMARAFIQDWNGVKESDLFVGAPDVEVNYDRKLFELASGDLTEICKEVAEKCCQATADYNAKLEDSQKN